MAHSYATQRMVEFSETDMAGIMHFANYFRWMESAEHEFFRAHGLSVHESHDRESAGWARVHAACTYEVPLRYQDTADIEIVVTGKTKRTLSYVCTIRRTSDQLRIARGEMTVVYVENDGAGHLSAQPMPAKVDRELEVAPEGILARVKE